MNKIELPAQALMAPLPVLIVTSGSLERPGAMTAAWTGIINSDPPVTYVSIRPERYTHNQVKESGVFVLNLVCEALARAVDYCGVVSGFQVDKVAHLGLTVEPGPHTKCPMLMESPVNIECRVRHVENLGSHDFFMADIVGIYADPHLIEDGALRLDKAGLIAFAGGNYTALGGAIGKTGFSLE